jgi:hypothetical protein
MSKTILDVHFTMHIEDRVITLVDIGTGYSITNCADLVIAELARGWLAVSRPRSSAVLSGLSMWPHLSPV